MTLVTHSSQQADSLVAEKRPGKQVTGAQRDVISVLQLADERRNGLSVRDALPFGERPNWSVSSPDAVTLFK
jgi:hypothetical protein